MIARNNILLQTHSFLSHSSLVPLFGKLLLFFSSITVVTFFVFKTLVNLHFSPLLPQLQLEAS